MLVHERLFDRVCAQKAVSTEHIMVTTTGSLRYLSDALTNCLAGYLRARLLPRLAKGAKSTNTEPFAHTYPTVQQVYS